MKPALPSPGKRDDLDRRSGSYRQLLKEVLLGQPEVVTRSFHFAKENLRHIWLEDQEIRALDSTPRLSLVQPITVICSK